MNSSPADMSSFWSASLQLWSNGIQGWNAAQGVCVRSGLYIFYLHLLIALIYLVEGWGARVCQMLVCRSEDNLQVSVIFFHPVGPQGSNSGPEAWWPVN